MNDNPQWKQELLMRCHQALAELPADFTAHITEETLEEVSLYEMQEQLVAMRAETRKVNRRTADAFSSFSDVLGGMKEDSGKMREAFLKNTDATGKGERRIRSIATSLIDLLDRVTRMENATEKEEEKTGWKEFFSNKDFIHEQIGSISILKDHIEALLKELKVKKTPISTGEAFNPLLMKAVGEASSAESELGKLVVAEELLTGYTLDDQCLRTAEVSLKRI